MSFSVISFHFKMEEFYIAETIVKGSGRYRLFYSTGFRPSYALDSIKSTVVEKNLLQFVAIVDSAHLMNT